MNKLSPRLILAAIALISFGLLAFAWFLQYGPEKQQPCPLCVLQRYTFIFIGLSALIGAIHPRRWTAVATGLFALTGIGLATWHVLKGSGMTSCARDPIGIFVNNLPTANWFPQYFFANGGCADQYFVLGILVQVWSLLWFANLTAACVLAYMKMAAQKPTSSTSA